MKKTKQKQQQKKKQTNIHKEIKCKLVGLQVMTTIATALP
jgi:hypothetical protein